MNLGRRSPPLNCLHLLQNPYFFEPPLSRFSTQSGKTERREGAQAKGCKPSHSWKFGRASEQEQSSGWCIRFLVYAMMANVIDPDHQWLVDCLSATLDPNPEVRSFAEASLNQASLRPGSTLFPFSLSPILFSLLLGYM